MWRYLRNRNFQGYKFRRQEAIGKFVVDFVFFDKKLIVELDGSQHVEQRATDQLRTAELERCSYRVIRFWNHGVISEIDAVLEKIRMEVINSPSSQPSP